MFETLAVKPLPLVCRAIGGGSVLPGGAGLEVERQIGKAPDVVRQHVLRLSGHSQLQFPGGSSVPNLLQELMSTMTGRRAARPTVASSPSDTACATAAEHSSSRGSGELEATKAGR